MQQSALGELITLILVIVIMLGGMAMIVGGPSLMGRYYRWVFRVVVLRPLEWGLHQLGIAIRAILRWVGRQLARFLRWGARQLGRLIVYLGRQFGRGIRYAWVRLTT